MQAPPVHHIAAGSLVSGHFSIRLWRVAIHQSSIPGWGVKKRAAQGREWRCSVATSGDRSDWLDEGEERSSALQVQRQGIACLAVRKPHVGEYWEVADIHCNAFFPDMRFPMDLLMRSDRVMAMLGSFSIESGLRKQCLVAVEGERVGKNAAAEPAAICGVATVDTLAEYLPRRRPFARRRSGIAYLSNVAVPPERRRRGIARRLVREAEAVAKSWGCRSIALHCDVENASAAALYTAQGYRVVSVPNAASWPQPKSVSGTDFQLMLKLL